MRVTTSRQRDGPPALRASRHPTGTPFFRDRLPRSRDPTVVHLSGKHNAKRVPRAMLVESIGMKGLEVRLSKQQASTASSSATDRNRRDRSAEVLLMGAMKPRIRRGSRSLQGQRIPGLDPVWWTSSERRTPCLKHGRHAPAPAAPALR